jgi:hypothetical protein
MLSISDPFIIQKCILQCNSAEFMFGHCAIDGLMLFKPSVHASVNGTLCIDICDTCHSSLIDHQMPKYVLANGLYQGNLPSQLANLTWVEEMVCAIFCHTALSSHCALVSICWSCSPQCFTWKYLCTWNKCGINSIVLPKTPADVNGTLSVIFIGPEKFRPELLKNIFYIRKHKVWQFLLWLQNHNILYSHIELDLIILEQYPEEGSLPGIIDNVIQDCKSDPSTIFEEESAALFEHPAMSLNPSESASDEPFVFLERVGVSDPEGDRLSRCTFIGATLRNLVRYKADTMLPDLILHRGSTTINEHKNPTLMPGMFPTLWPFGIGGFEDPSCIKSISFWAQANYCFDIPDHSFQSHNSYSFIVLNIPQWRGAHLHTHFTVHKPNFELVATELIKITPNTLLSTAAI